MVLRKIDDDEMSLRNVSERRRVIILDGKEVNFSGLKEALENGVAMVHQELNQCLERSVIDNLFLGRYPKNSLGVVDEGRMKKGSI